MTSTLRTSQGRSGLSPLLEGEGRGIKSVIVHTPSSDRNLVEIIAEFGRYCCFECD